MKKSILIILLVAPLAMVGLFVGSNSKSNSSRKSEITKSDELNDRYRPVDGHVEKINLYNAPFRMVYVHGGDFLMGVQSDDPSAANYRPDTWTVPVHREYVKDFYIGETEVTQALWEAVMKNNPSEFKGDNLPVENVSWYDVHEFISRLNRLTGRTFRLPTEAEWEYAARGGSRGKGDMYMYSGSDSIDEVAWYDDNCKETTHPVKKKRANKLGIYDMTGNVLEWCSDCWRDDYESSPDCSSRVSRGGSCGSFDRICNVWYRFALEPERRGCYTGFRLVMKP